MTEAAAPTERDLRQHLRSLAADGALPEDLLAAWRDSLASRVEALQRDGATGDRGPGGEAADLESRVLALEEGGSASGAAAAGRALALGEETRFHLWLASAVAEEASADPLGRIESEIDWVERSAGDLRRWDAALGEPAARVLSAAGELRGRLTALKLSRLERGAQSRAGTEPVAAASVSWLAVLESFQVEAEMARGPDAPGGAVRGEAVRAARGEHLRRCTDALRQAGPLEASRFLQRAAADLSDEASAVLSENAGARPELRIPALRSLRGKLDAFRQVFPAPLETLVASEILPAEERGRFERQLRSLARDRRRALTAEKESEVMLRLERTFGPRNVRRFENLLFVLVLLLLALIALEWRLPEGSPWRPYLHGVDIAFCLVFQLDFFVRWGLSRWSGRYFLRHFFFESLPALPFIFFDRLRALVAARLLGLRGVMFLILRVARVGAFLIRGSDRAVEKLRRFLDRDVILFGAHPVAGAPESPARLELLALESRREKAARALFADLPWAERPPVLAAHVEQLAAEAPFAAALPAPYLPRTLAHRGEVHLERVVQGLLAWDASRAVEVLGHEGVERAARWLGFLDAPLVRSMPVVRRFSPAARLHDPPETVAAAVRTAGGMLEGLLGACRFWSDLAGITTGPQVLDRLASALIATTRRPAIRLLIFGAAFLLLSGIAEVLGRERLREALRVVDRYLGLPLIILGTSCLVVLLLGRWLKRIAGEALDVYLRTADAHFYALLKVWKLERSGPHLETLHRSVFLPELKLRGGQGASRQEWLRFLEESAFAREGCAWPRPPADPRFAPFQEDRQTVCLLYRDFLDGPILNRLDDKTSVQLLGNLVVQDIRRSTLRLGRKELRKLERLDLEKDRFFGFGPYFWFRFITESLAIETSKLVMEYKTNCIPRDQLALAPPEARERFRIFLEARQGSWQASVERLAAKAGHVGEPVLSDEFNALDFVIVRPEREAAIRERFGDPVLAALRRDRRGMVRDIFGTHPYHLLPREERSFNPYRFYWRYFGGARFLFFPLLAALAGARMLGRSLARGIGLVLEVLGRRTVIRGHLSRVAGFDVAIRKLNRMRKPFFMEALRLRAAVDLEYLGLRIPGHARDPGAPGYEEDLEFIGAFAGERGPIAALRAAAVRDLRRFRTFAAKTGWLEGELDRALAALDPTGGLEARRGEAVRALVTAYITNHEGLRSLLTARDAAREFVEQALARKETWGMRLRLAVRGALSRVTPRGRRRRRVLGEYLRGEEPPAGLSRRLRAKVWRAFLAAAPGTEEAVRLAADLARSRGTGEDLAAAALTRAVAAHASWTRKIITARALQAVTVLDIQCYRDLVWEAGGYGEG